MHDDDPNELRRKAAHCQRLAKILADKTAAAELLEIAAHMEAKALKIDGDERQKPQPE